MTTPLPPKRTAEKRFVDYSKEPKQMWKCVKCKNIRQWGYGEPEDKKRRRLLTCTGTCDRGIDGKLPPVEEQEHVTHVYSHSE